MALPTFFIIGAPKAGTTALYAALLTHPQLYLSPVKEPKFFLCDGQTHRAEPGSYVYIPRGTVHTFRNVGETPGEFLGTATPAGHEGFFEDADRLQQTGPLTLEGILDVCRRNGIEVIG